MNLLKGSFFLKVLALISALIAYFYIHNEVYNVKESVTDPSYKLIKLTAKKLPLKVRLATEPPDGYQIVEQGVVASPTQVIVIGPEALLEDAQSAETALVDVSENTHTATKKIPLESVSGIHLAGEPFLVDVTVPVKKIEPKEPTHSNA